MSSPSTTPTRPTISVGIGGAPSPRIVPMPESPTTPTQTPRIVMPEVRPQAGPLPSKRGEIGYQEGLHGVVGSPSRSRSPTSPMPARHPADREAPVTARVDLEGPDAPPSASASASAPSNPDEAATPSIRKPRWKPSKIFGVRLTTIAALVIQILLIAVTVTGWVFAAEKLSFAGNQDSNSSAVSFSGSSAIFVHVLFGVLLVVQLIFLERRVFVIRAERFMHLHPGEILPSHRQGPLSSVPGMGYAPWNRPPLPTYAAALMQSGWGTGDVEDSVIAQPPPPAYGNTRGSTLLLAGFLRNSQITSRPISVGSVSSQMTERGAVAVRGRPVSYASVDGGWVEVRRVSEDPMAADARRSMILEQTLMALERPQPAVLRPETRT